MNDTERDEKLYSLVSLDEFKEISGVDDRDDVVSVFCLKAATAAIERYCQRKLIYQKHRELFVTDGQTLITLGEYPARKIRKIETKTLLESGEISWTEITIMDGLISDAVKELPYQMMLPENFPRGISLKITYKAGYKVCEMPDDLKAACFEFAAWNMNKYKAKKIGMTGKGGDYESSMPENVKQLIEPYRRRTI